MGVNFVSGRDGDGTGPGICDEGVEQIVHGAKNSDTEVEGHAEGEEGVNVEVEGVKEKFVNEAISWDEGL